MLVISREHLVSGTRFGWRLVALLPEFFLSKYAVRRLGRRKDHVNLRAPLHQEKVPSFGVRSSNLIASNRCSSPVIDGVSENSVRTS